MKIIIGSDPFAYTLKRTLAAHLSKRGIEVVDTDSYADTPYFEVAEKSAKMLAANEADGAILLCGTGAGMCIVANKIRGIKAVSVESVFAAKQAKAINRANIITMGAMIVGELMANAIADAWIDTKFAEGFESLKGFLEQAFDEVSKIDEKNRK